MRTFLIFFILPLAIVAASAAAHAGGEKDKKEPDKVEKQNGKQSYLLVVPPAGGKEIKLVDWRFTQGTRAFSPTGPEKIDPKTKMPTGPEYLEFREEKSTTYKNGVFTLIPLTSIRKITYDRDKKTVAVSVVTAEPDDVILNGLTKFERTNKITIEAEEIIDGLGAATVKFQGGIDKGLHSVAFPAPKAAEKVKGAPSFVTADDKEKTKHAAHDVQPLWLVDGAYRIVPYIMFKKTVKVEMDKIAGIRFVPSEDKKRVSNDYEVTLKDGVKHTLTILTSVDGEKRKMTFVGLLGRVPAGYKLFSLDAIYEYRVMDDEKK